VEITSEPSHRSFSKAAEVDGHLCHRGCALDQPPVCHKRLAPFDISILHSLLYGKRGCANVCYPFGRISAAGFRSLTVDMAAGMRA
jgi:hypothetical protein